MTEGERREPCRICAVSRQPLCWAWHRYAQAELNPIALLQRMTPASTVGEIVDYVRAVTGITVDVNNLPALAGERREPRWRVAEGDTGMCGAIVYRGTELSPGIFTDDTEWFNVGGRDNADRVVAALNASPASSALPVSGETLEGRLRVEYQTSCVNALAELLLALDRLFSYSPSRRTDAMWDAVDRTMRQGHAALADALAAPEGQEPQ